MFSRTYLSNLMELYKVHFWILFYFSIGGLFYFVCLMITQHFADNLGWSTAVVTAITTGIFLFVVSPLLGAFIVSIWEWNRNQDVVASK